MISCGSGNNPLTGTVLEPRVLLVDSSTPTCSVALSRGATPVAESLLNIVGTHSEKLLEQIDLLLREVDWRLTDLDLLAVVTGPGSFTGLRIGIATVKGLAQVTGKPVAAISSLQLLAMNVPLSRVPVHVFFDARKGEVYTQPFIWHDGLPEATTAARVLPPAELLAELSGEVVLVGNGVPLYRQLIEEKLGSRALEPPASAHQIRISLAAPLVLQARERSCLLSPEAVLPTYVRPSDAELQARRDNRRASMESASGPG